MPRTIACAATVGAARRLGWAPQNAKRVGKASSREATGIFHNGVFSVKVSNMLFDVHQPFVPLAGLVSALCWGLCTDEGWMQQETAPESYAAKISNNNLVEAATEKDGSMGIASDVGPLFAKMKPRAEAAVRVARLVLTVAAMAVDYKSFELAKFLKEEYNFGWGIVEDSVVQDFEQLQYDLWHAQEQQGIANMAEVNAATPKELELAKEQGRRWRSKVVEAAASLAEAEMAGGYSPKSVVHRRAAERLLLLCGKNGGVYVKLGQLLSQMDHVLPPEFIEALRSTLNQAPTTPYEDVREVIREELGAYPEEIWESFETVPIASASLAQVHVAVDSKGQKLAIKVQHRGLRETSQGDMDAVALAVHTVGYIFPEFSYTWLADEVFEALPKELDFQNEASNSLRCAALLGDRDDVCVPSVVEEQTTKRILTMHFEEGVRATDVEAMKAQGVRLARVASLISKVFCNQIFRHGFVHCDPHGANVLVRPHPKSGQGAMLWGQGSLRPQLVLLDHGLYRELPLEFRVNYCRLWKSIIFKDLEDIKMYCERMNAGDMYRLLAAMIASRSWDEISDRASGINGLHTKNVLAEKNMVQGYVAQYAVEITRMLARVPRELLLLFKTNDCLRHIDRTLGAPINTFTIAARTCLSVLREEDANEVQLLLLAMEVQERRLEWRERAQHVGH